jgi:hypothetical protein
MSRIPAFPVSLALICALLLSAAPFAARAQDATPMAGALPDGAEVVASGLTNPRGFTWGADGTLFVGLAGSGGDTPGPEGSPFSGGPTAGIAAIRDGDVSMLATGLASAIWRDIDWVWGVNDVAILGDQLYALVGGGGVGAGNPDQPSGVYVIAADGSATLVADLGTWVDANPVTPAPYVEGSANVRHVGLDGEVTDVWTGLTTVTGLAVGPDGALYVAELSSEISDGEPFLTEGSGRILRQTGPDAGDVVASGLDYPVALGFGPVGELYVAVPAFGADEGSGEILRVEVEATS